MDDYGPMIQGCVRCLPLIAIVGIIASDWGGVLVIGFLVWFIATKMNK